VTTQKIIDNAEQAPSEVRDSIVCGALCDHGSECLLLHGHVPQDKHETQHGCIFFDQVLTERPHK